MLVHSRPFVRSIQWLSGYKRLDVKQKCLICCCRNIQSIVIRNTFISRNFGPLAWSETRHSVTLWSQVRRQKLAATWPRYVGHCRQAEVLSELSFAPFRLKIWTGVFVDCHRRQGNVCSVKSILDHWLPGYCCGVSLNHWGRVTHTCMSNYNTIGSDNGLSPGRRRAIIWSNARISLIGPLGRNFSEILSEIQPFSFKKIHLKMSPGKWRLFCLSLNALTHCPHMATNIMP